MEAKDAVSKVQLAELLNKNWLTHDAMWFSHCLREVGIEKTSRINKLAARSMAAVEVKRIMRLIGMQKIETFEDFQRFFLEGFELVRSDFMKFDYSFPGKNLLKWQTTQCFAYDGIKRLGVLDQYRCGILERIYGWLDGAGVGFRVAPDGNACLMHTAGKCLWEIRTDLA